RLDVDQHAMFWRRVDLAPWVDDACDGKALIRLLPADGLLVAAEFDRHAVVDTDCPQGPGKIVVAEPPVLRRVRHYDPSAAAADHLVQAEVVEVTSIGKVYPAAVAAHLARQLFEQLQEAVARLRAAPNATSDLVWVWRPPTEPGIRKGQKSGHRGG